MKLVFVCIGSFCFLVLLIYLYIKQYNMVVTWVRPEADAISDTAEWIYGRYSSGRIVHAMEVRDAVAGWDALAAIWPIAAILSLVSLAGGVSFGYFTRDNQYAAEHDKALAEQERQYKFKIDHAERLSQQADQKDGQSRRRNREADALEADVKRREVSVTEREQKIMKIIDDQVRDTKKKYENLQEDHNKRGHKMNNLENDKIEFKKKNNALELEILELQEKLHDLTQKNLSLKKGK